MGHDSATHERSADEQSPPNSDGASSNTPSSKPAKPRFVKTNIPNLVKLDPMSTYYGRCKVNGKLIRESLGTKDFTVAKSKVRQWLIDVRGRVNATEGSMGELVEDYVRRLKLQVDGRRIRQRTMETKIECLTQIEKVWEELFTHDSEQIRGNTWRFDSDAPGLGAGTAPATQEAP